MSRRRTSLTNIRNFIGTTSLRTSRLLSITSMLLRVGAGGLQASTATYFVPSVSCAIRGHSHRVVADARLSSHGSASRRAPSARAIRLGIDLSIGRQYG